MKIIRMMIGVMLIPMMALANYDDLKEVDGIWWSYTVSNGTVCIKSPISGTPAISRATLGEIKIPVSFDGRPVTTIGEYAFRDCKFITSVEIPVFVKTIEEGAFGGCTALKSMVIPDGVTTIGRHAFCWCPSLASVMIPDSVTMIGDGVFAGSGSDSVSICVSPGNSAYKMVDDCLLSKDGSLLIRGSMKPSVTIPSSVITIGASAFLGCQALVAVTIPNGVKTIGEAAFLNCSKLTSITIPESVETISAHAFSDCRALVSISLPTGLTKIDNRAFAECESLVSVTIPNGVTSIGRGAFYGCKALMTVYASKARQHNVRELLEKSGFDCQNVKFEVPQS